MTVSATTTRNDYIAAAGQTVFAYTFKALDSTDLVVTKNSVVQSAYSVSGIGVATGGNVTFTSGVTANDAIAIYLAMPVTRDTNYQEGGAFLAGEVNADFDKIYIGAIQNENAIDRSMRLPESEPSVAMTLPIKDDRKGRYLQFNAITGAPEAGQSVIGDYSAGTGLDLTNYVFSIDSTVATLTGTQTLSGKTLTSPILNENLSGSAFLDEDNMASNSSTKVASQQSIKAYVDSQVGATDTLSEVLTNGNTTNGNDVKFGDNDKATFGASDGLEIFSDGTDSFIKETDTGSLQIWAKDFEVYNAGGTETLINADANAGVQLYFNNAQKLATTSTGIDVTGTATMDGLTVDGVAQLGTVSIYDNGTNATIAADSGHDLELRGRLGQAVNLFSNGTTTATFASNGDISFYEDTGTTAKLVWDASAESLGIDGLLDVTKATSTASGAVELAIFSANGDSGRGLSVSAFNEGGVNSAGVDLNAQNTTNATLSLSTNSTERMRIDSAGNVGIGQTSPKGPLHVYGTEYSYFTSNIAGVTPHSTTQGIALGWNKSSGAGESIIAHNKGGGSAGGLVFANNDGGVYREDMRIDSSGNLLVGKSSISNVLGWSEVVQVGGANPAISLDNSSSVQWDIANFGGNFTIWKDGSEQARIDSSGNLLVGTTDTAPATNNVDGIVLRNEGHINVSRASGVVGYFNRKTNDGTILSFHKDGTNVGSIGSNGNRPYFASTNCGIRLGAADLLPATSTGVISDNVVSLGSSTGRWNNLYLSGGVYLGGTGAANKLDDYEEGTFTPAITFGGASVGLTYTTTRGRYTKVGRLVTVQIGIDINNKGTSTGAMNVTGLPFASATFSGGYSGHVGAMRVEGGWTGLTGATIPYIEESGSTTIVIRQGTSTGTNPVTDANTTSGYFFITSTYQTA